MNWKKLLGLCAVGVTGFVVGAAVGYIRALNDIDRTACPENCECAGECAMCAGAHTVAAEAQAEADAAVEAPVATESDISEGVSDDTPEMSVVSDACDEASAAEIL